MHIYTKKIPDFQKKIFLVISNYPVTLTNTVFLRIKIFTSTPAINSGSPSKHNKSHRGDSRSLG